MLIPLSPVAALALYGTFLMTAVQAQNQDPSVLRDRLQKKTESSFFEIADWSRDFKVACARAKERESLVLAYFTRSYQP